MNNQPDKTLNDKKPKWLRALEAQSWQAELIASGLAIYGSLSLGSYLEYFFKWVSLRLDERTLFILSFLALYAFSAHAILVVSFITHLILRILWAGILGLSSVFPTGINTKTEVYPEYFKEKLKRDYPNLSAYSLELDKMCSLIFSILCAMVIVLVNISIWLIIYIILSLILVKFLPESVVNFIGFALLGIYFLIAIVATLMTQGKFKDARLSKKYGYELTMKSGKFVYLIGYKAFNYISQTIRSNTTSKSFFLGMFLMMIVSMFLAVPNYVETVDLYHPKNFANMSPEEGYVITENYKNKLQDELVLHPFIQSEIIKDDFLQLYIPRFKREQPTVDDLCDKYTWDDDLSDKDNRRLRAISRNKCANKYYTIYIDDKKQHHLEYFYQYEKYNNRPGYEVFIGIDSLKQGNHTLTIESKYKAEDKYYIRTIPFYKTKN